MCKIIDIDNSHCAMYKKGDQSTQQVDLFVVKLKQYTCSSTLAGTGNFNNLFDIGEVGGGARFDGTLHT